MFYVKYLIPAKTVQPEISLTDVRQIQKFAWKIVCFDIYFKQKMTSRGTIEAWIKS